MSTTLFKEIPYKLSNLIDDIEMGEIGLPDIQRPFVWKNAKVRDLFDSMYRGYPVGYLLFWENKVGDKTKQIGANTHLKVPQLLIVDGQQRLTSLYAVIKGIAVVRENYETEKIEIAFRPSDGSFQVCDAAIRRDPEYISDISKLFIDASQQYDLITAYISKLEAHREKSGETLDSEERSACVNALQKLFSLNTYPFTTIQLSAQIDEEQVAEVFVRINSEGKKLNQADFILTLMSVFWEEGRKELENFCREARQPSIGTPSSFNHFVNPSPDQLLRVAIGIAFRRARLKSAYSVLRGKDMETEEFSEERRDAQFDRLKQAQSHVLNLQHWHDFLGILKQSGFTGSNMISSATTVYYTYILYLIGRIDLKVNVHTLGQVIGRWFFMASVTSRYTGGSPETLMERDLAALRDINNSADFLSWIERIMVSEFTSDFWSVTLPSRLDTSSAISPLLYAYYASLNLLGAKALFSKKLVRDTLEPSLHANKSAVERHHLYPKHYLGSLGIKTTRVTNQIANYALIEWNDNIGISDTPPSEYFEKYWSRLTEKEQKDQAYWHALPTSWEAMEYQAFLDARRKGIAKVIADGFDRLTHGEILEDAEDTYEARIQQGEGFRVEFKSTLRVNLHTGKPDPKMEHAVLKTIAAFMNSKGGTLFVGVNDDGEALGLDQDNFPNEDKLLLHLDNLIKSKLGDGSFAAITPEIGELGGRRFLAVECEASETPVFLKNGQQEEFYIRAGASSPALPGSQTHEYIQTRFKGAPQTTTEQHNRLSVRPYLTPHTHTNYSNEGVSIDYTMQNQGMGTAVIKKVELFLDDKPFEFGDDPIEEITTAVFGNYDGFSVKRQGWMGAGYALADKTEYDYGQIFFEGMSKEQSESLKPEIERIQIRVEYASVYDDHFVFDSREEDTAKEAKQKGSPAQERNREFWKLTQQALSEAGFKRYEGVTPSKDHWQWTGSGFAGVPYSMISLQSEARVELCILRPVKQDSKQIFDLLHNKKDEIEQRFGAKMDWLRLDDKKSSRISYGHPFDGSDRDQWPQMVAWLVEHIQRWEKAFAPALDKVREEMKQG